MVSDVETARQIELRKTLIALRKLTGADGVLFLTFSHTDEHKSAQYHVAGQVPDMQDVLSIIGKMIAVTSYDLGKEAAKQEAMESILNIKPTA